MSKQIDWDYRTNGLSVYVLTDMDVRDFKQQSEGVYSLETQGQIHFKSKQASTDGMFVFPALFMSQHAI